MLDHYRVVEALGSGGMGAVYRAHDEELGRDVALKVLSAESADEVAGRAQLLQEARLASALNHPSICTIYQVGASAGQPFIAMEYITGLTLAELSMAGPLPVEQALTYAIQIADALGHAHARGVIHRDLKCANVIAMSAERVKVLDFGLAKRIESVDLNAPTMTASLDGGDLIVGTLPYMAPEILSGKAATAASDVWAFGVLLYQLLARTHPFEGQSSYELTTSIMRDAPRPLPNTVPRVVVNIIQRCLRKEPELRYSSGGELRAALEAAASGGAQSVEPRPAWALRAALLASAAVVAALSVWGTLQLIRSQHKGPDSIAILPFANRSGSPETEYLSDGLTDDLINALSRQPNLKISPRNSAFTYKGKEVGAAQVGRELGVKAVLTGNVMVQDGGMVVDAELTDAQSLKRLWKGHYSRALSDSVALREDVARELLSRLGGENGAENPAASASLTRNNDAYQSGLKGSYHLYKHTPEELEQARQNFEAALAADPRYAPAYAGLSAYYSILADTGAAPPAMTLLKARAAAQKALQLDPNVTVATTSLAYVKLVRDWDFRGAEADFQRLIRAQPNVPDNYVEYAICLRTLGRRDEAVDSSRMALMLDPLNVETSASSAWNLYFARRFDEAIKQFQDTLVLDPSFAAGRFGLALAYQQKHMESKAAGEFEKYLNGTVGEEAGAEFRKTYRRYGYNTALQGLWKMQLSFLNAQSQQEYVSPMLFASTYALLGRKEEAFEWLNKSYEERSIKLLDLEVDPDFDWLHSDPRFTELKKNIGLP